MCWMTNRTPRYVDGFLTVFRDIVFARAYSFGAQVQRRLRIMADGIYEVGLSSWCTKICSFPVFNWTDFDETSYIEKLMHKDWRDVFTRWYYVYLSLDYPFFQTALSLCRTSIREKICIILLIIMLSSKMRNDTSFPAVSCISFALLILRVSLL